jgi:hypothetical protein
MKLSRRKLEQIAGIAVAVMLMSLSGSNSWAQATKTIKIIVPYPPGGTNDTIARVLGEQVGRAQGRTIVVENRPGASTQIGTESASRAAPDGNSLLFAGPNFVFIPHLRKVSYDSLTSFEPICNLTNTPVVILVNNASPYHTIADLIDGARAKPSELTFASFGPASPEQVAFELLERAARAKNDLYPISRLRPSNYCITGATSDIGARRLPDIGAAGRCGQTAEARNPITETDRRASEPAYYVRGGLQRHRTRALVRIVCASQDPEGNDLSTRQLVHRGDSGTRGEGEACRTRILSCRNMRH